jgi:hypothetical protein
LRLVPRRVTRHWRLVAVVVLLGLVAGFGAITTNALGAGDRFDRLVSRIDRLIAGPVPERSTLPTIDYTPPPLAVMSPTPQPSPTRTPTRAPAGSEAPPPPTATPTATPTPTPPPAREPVDFTAVSNPEAVFAHQDTKDWCAVAGVAMVLAIHGKGAPSEELQQDLARRVKEWESWEDSHNGRWGPAAMALALEEYGVPGYQIRAYASRADALRDAARTISELNAPVILLPWRGAHTWVMSGYRADADPTVFPDATVTGAYILDPWYPDASSIWGQSDPPGAFQDAAEMERNYLPWARPEGAYPDRDGKWIAVVPTVPIPRAASG